MNIQSQYPDVNDLLQKYWVEANQDYNSLHVNGVDPFCLAIRTFDHVSANFWFNTLGEQFNHNKSYPHGQSIGYLVVQDGDLETIKLIFDKMLFDVNVVPMHGYSILGNAIENAADDVFEYILNIPNIDLRMRDSVKPFYSPLERACKLQDVNRVSMLLNAMLEKNILLSPRDLKVMHELFTSSQVLENLLTDYLTTLKKHLHITTEHFELTPNYKANQLLAYLEFWNIQGRINQSFVPIAVDGNKKYSGLEAVTMVLDKLLPLIGFGMLPADNLMQAYRSIKHLEIMYKLPSKFNIDKKLDHEISQALNKYSHGLDWHKLQSFKAVDLYLLVDLIKDLDAFTDAMQSHQHTVAIKQAIKQFNHCLEIILASKLSLVGANTLSAKIAKVATAMQAGNNLTLNQFVSSLEHSNLPKATKAFLTSNPLDNPQPSSLPQVNSHNSFKPKNNQPKNNRK